MKLETTTAARRRERILEAAERAFANQGFAGASLRHIVQEADVNLATVYYYFHSKQGLMAAVFNRRFGPLRAEQLARLQAAAAQARGRPLPVEKIMACLMLPLLRLSASASAKSQIALRLIGRIVTEPNVQTQKLLRGQYEEARKVFVAAFRRSLPQLPRADLLWRIEFFWGALAFILCNAASIRQKTGGACNPLDQAKTLAQMTAYAAAGFHAPRAKALKLPLQ